MELRCANTKTYLISYKKRRIQLERKYRKNHNSFHAAKFTFIKEKYNLALHKRIFHHRWQKKMRNVGGKGEQIRCGSKSWRMWNVCLLCNKFPLSSRTFMTSSWLKLQWEFVVTDGGKLIVYADKHHVQLVITCEKLRHEKQSKHKIISARGWINNS